MFQHTVSIEGVCVHCGKVIPMVTDPKPKVVNGSYQLVYERCSCSQPAQPQESEEGQKTPTNTGSLQLPGWKSVESEMRRWLSDYESDAPQNDRWVPEDVVRHIYEFIARQQQAGA